MELLLKNENRIREMGCIFAFSFGNRVGYFSVHNPKLFPGFFTPTNVHENLSTFFLPVAEILTSWTGSLTCNSTVYILPRSVPRSH